MFKPKSAKNDFNLENLPHTRKEVFIDVIRLHFFDLIKCGLLLFAFCIPFIALTIYKEMAMIDYQERIYSTTDTIQIYNLLRSMVLFDDIIAVVEIPLWMFIGVGLSGVMRIIRQFAWEENVFMRYDFVNGIKQNVKQIEILMLLVGIINLVYTVVQNAIIISLGGIETYLVLIPQIILLIVFVPILFYVMVCASIYNNTFMQNVRIACVLYANNMGKTVLALLCTLILSILMLIPNIFCKIIGNIMFSILFPTCMLWWWLSAYDMLDAKINIINHIDLIGRGTVPKRNTEDQQ